MSGFARFEWDDTKAASNLAKHGLSFEEAITVFDDPRALLAADGKHSGGEDRYLAIGETAYSRTLAVVVFTFRGARVRVISARRASRKERAGYGAHSR